MASPAHCETYAWDFRNGHFDNLSLVPMGPGAVNLLRPSRDGLQIIIPAGYDVKTVGFSPDSRSKAISRSPWNSQFSVAHFR